MKDWLTDARDAVVEKGFEVGLTAIGVLLLDGALSSVPGMGGAILSYKQKRMERNVNAMIKHLVERMDEIQTPWVNKPSAIKEMLKERFAGIVCDYVIDEKEQSKIPYLANGLISIITSETPPSEHMVIEYYDILTRLRSIDLQALIDYVDGTFDQHSAFEAKPSYIELRGISYDEFNYIRSKLIDLHLFSTDRDRQYEQYYAKLSGEIQAASSGLIYRNKPTIHAKPPKDFNYYPTELGRSITAFFLSEIKAAPTNKSAREAGIARGLSNI